MEREFSFKTDFDGSMKELVNMIPQHDGTIRRLEFPTNAVIVQLFRREDEEGKEYWERVVSASVVTPELREEILEEARRTWRAINGVPG